jgi:hypothetical protein
MRRESGNAKPGYDEDNALTDPTLHQHAETAIDDV